MPSGRPGCSRFETDLYELDRKHPGFYAQRIEAVEVELIGLLPDNSAPEGTLTAGGVTNFRKLDGSVGKRVHQVDTMALSNFTLRDDSFLYSTDTGVRGLFQGYGAGATWQMHLSRRSNNFDFRRILDVNLMLYYMAMYDSALEASVLTTPPRDGELEMLRTQGRPPARFPQMRTLFRRPPTERRMRFSPHVALQCHVPHRG